MRVVIQRVIESNVIVKDLIVGEISKGLLVLLAIEKNDTYEDLLYIKEKILGLRIFNDDNDIMNLSVIDTKSDILLVSQFTLYGDVSKGKRPSYIKSAGGEKAEDFYNKMILELKKSGLKIQNGIFGADMKVNIVNDGPVTIIIDSK